MTPMTDKLMAVSPSAAPARGERKALLAARRILLEKIHELGQAPSEGQMKLVVALAYVERRISGKITRVRTAEVEYAAEWRAPANAGN